MAADGLASSSGPERTFVLGAENGRIEPIPTIACDAARRRIVAQSVQTDCAPVQKLLAHNWMSYVIQLVLLATRP